MSNVPPPTSYPPPPPPPPGTPPANSDRSLMIILSYLGILALVPLLTKKDDPDVQWHAKNGLVLGVAWFVLWFVFFVAGWMLPWGIQAALGTIGCVLAVAFLAVDIIALVKAINGERFRIPVVTDIAEKL